MASKTESETHSNPNSEFKFKESDDKQNDQWSEKALLQEQSLNDSSISSKLVIDSEADEMDVEPITDVDDTVTEDWQQVRNTKRNRSSPETAQQPKSRKIKTNNTDSNTNYFVYLKGTDFDLANDVAKKPLKYMNYFAYTHGISKPQNFKMIKNTLRITCTNQSEQNRLLKTTEINGKQVEASLPWSSLTERQTRESTSTYNNEHLIHGIIFKVSTELTDEEIVAATEAVKVRRLKTRDSESAQLLKTETVVLSFDGEELPTYLHIGFLKFKVSQYIPRPFRCTRCQQYGHRAERCSRMRKCPKCGEDHDYVQCNIQDRQDMHCPNCSGPHSAGWQGCPEHQKVKQVLQIKTTEKLSYRDALLKHKIETEAIKQHQQESQDIQKRHEQTEGLRQRQSHPRSKPFESTSTDLPTQPPRTSSPKDNDAEPSETGTSYLQLTPKPCASSTQTSQQPHAICTKEEELTNLLGQITKTLLYILEHQDPGPTVQKVHHILTRKAQEAGIYIQLPIKF